MVEADCKRLVDLVGRLLPTAQCPGPKRDAWDGRPYPCPLRRSAWNLDSDIELTVVEFYDIPGHLERVAAE